jgi:hypothetical protein
LEKRIYITLNNEGQTPQPLNTKQLKTMKETLTIPQKPSNTGDILDLASEMQEREIKIPRGAKFVIILPSYYGCGNMYSTHRSAEAAAKAIRRLKRDGYAYQVFDADGHSLHWDGEQLLPDHYSRELATFKVD